MAIEIERKFLVHADKLPPLPDGQHYLQGYLSLEPQVRYRMVDDKVTITIKSNLKEGSGRNEFEFTNTLDSQEREVLKKLAIRKPIEKIRYKIPYDGLVWEIDIYQGENLGLITAEVELPAIDHPVNFPEWINSAAEVGGDPKYFNVNLGEHPYSSWDK